MSKKENNRLEHVKNRFLKKSSELQLAHMQALVDSSGWGSALEKFMESNPVPEKISREMKGIINFLDSILKEVNHPSQATDQQGRKVNLQTYLLWLTDQVFPTDILDLPTTNHIPIEDLPSLLADLALFDYWKKKSVFHEHIRNTVSHGDIKNPADIHHYAETIGKKRINGLRVFQQAIKPFRNVGALSPTERSEIDQQLLNGHDASLVHKTINWPELGFRVLKLHTYEAAQSYGRRTRWCTSHKNTREWFDKYAGELLLYENAEGERVQIDFSTAQWKNAHNEDVCLPVMIDPNFDIIPVLEEKIERLKGTIEIESSDDFLYALDTPEERNELASTLYPEFENALWDAVKRNDQETFSKLLFEMQGVKEWKAQLFKKGGLKRFFGKAASEIDGSNFVDFVEQISVTSSIAKPIEFLTRETVHYALKKSFESGNDERTIAKIFGVLTNSGDFDSLISPEDQDRGITILRSITDPDKQKAVDPWIPLDIKYPPLH